MSLFRGRMYQIEVRGGGGTLAALYACREWENSKEKGVFATFRKKVDEVPLKKNPVADSRTLFPPVFVMLPFIHTHGDDQISSAYPVVAWADRSKKNKVGCWPLLPIPLSTEAEAGLTVDFAGNESTVWGEEIGFQIFLQFCSS